MGVEDQDNSIFGEDFEDSNEKSESWLSQEFSRLSRKNAETTEGFASQQNG